MNRKHVLWKLFVSTLYLSAFTFGGGYVIVTLMKETIAIYLVSPAPRRHPLNTTWEICTRQTTAVKYITLSPSAKTSGSVENRRMILPELMVHRRMPFLQ